MENPTICLPKKTRQQQSNLAQSTLKFVESKIFYFCYFLHHFIENRSKNKQGKQAFNSIPHKCTQALSAKQNKKQKKTYKPFLYFPSLSWPPLIWKIIFLFANKLSLFENFFSKVFV
jgi:hypothetical protein